MDIIDKGFDQISRGDREQIINRGFSQLFIAEKSGKCGQEDQEWKERQNTGKSNIAGQRKSVVFIEAVVNIEND